MNFKSIILECSLEKRNYVKELCAYEYFINDFKTHLFKVVRRYFNPTITENGGLWHCYDLAIEPIKLGKDQLNDMLETIEHWKKKFNSLEKKEYKEIIDYQKKQEKFKLRIKKELNKNTITKV